MSNRKFKHSCNRIYDGLYNFDLSKKLIIELKIHNEIMTLKINELLLDKTQGLYEKELREEFELLNELNNGWTCLFIWLQSNI